MKVIISEQYKENQELNEFVKGLPRTFLEGGEVLHNARNQIRRFTLSDGLQIVVKRFGTLGWLRRAIYTFFVKSKALRSFANASELNRRGIFSPNPVACVEFRRFGLLSDAYYLCENDERKPIAEVLGTDNWRQDVARALAELAAKMHRKGILHGDFNSTNVRFSETPEGEISFSLIDVNRMRMYGEAHPIPLPTRLENLTRFTGKMDVFEFVVRHYAQTMGEDVEQTVQLGLKIKQKHDRNWRLRKRLTHPLRK